MFHYDPQGRTKEKSVKRSAFKTSYYYYYKESLLQPSYVKMFVFCFGCCYMVLERKYNATRKFSPPQGLLSSSCGGLELFGLKGDFAGRTDKRTDNGFKEAEMPECNSSRMQECKNFRLQE